MPFTVNKLFQKLLSMSRKRLFPKPPTLQQDLEANSKRPVAVFTICQDEEFFLPLWLRHYRKSFEPQDIYVLDHDSRRLTITRAEANVIPVFRSLSFDHNWLVKTVQSFQQFLFQSYETVIFCEADELLLPDPRLFSGSLVDLCKSFAHPTTRCVGLELLGDWNSNSEFDIEKPMLHETRLFKNSRYDKPIVSRIPLQWQLGFHTCTEKSQPDDRLIMWHLHCMNFPKALERASARAERKWPERDIAAGWGFQNRLHTPDQVRGWFETTSKLAEQQIPPEWMEVFW